MVTWMREDLDVGVRTATVIFSITPLVYMLATPFAGRAADRYPRKALLGGGGVATGLLYVGWGGWWLGGRSRAVRVGAVVAIQILSGVVNPFFTVPVLPDMLESRSASDGGGDDDEDATNLLSALYTTTTNLGGVVGPAIATLGVRAVGFQDTLAAFGGVIAAASAGFYLAFGRSPPHPRPTRATYSKLHRPGAAADPDDADGAGLELADAPADSPDGV